MRVFAAIALASTAATLLIACPSPKVPSGPPPEYEAPPPPSWLEGDASAPAAAVPSSEPEAPPVSGPDASIPGA